MIHLHPRNIHPHTSPEPSARHEADGRLAAATPPVFTDGGHRPDGCVAAALSSPSSSEAIGQALSSRALGDVLAVRIAQIEQFGHTQAADDRLSLLRWGQLFSSGAGSLAADIRNGLPRDKWRRKLVKLAAFTLAMIERIDREPTP